MQRQLLIDDVDVETLLNRMESVLQRSGDVPADHRWYAALKGGGRYGRGATAKEAMLDAISAAEDHKKIMDRVFGKPKRVTLCD
jgi:hypothetical protein